VLLVLVGAGAYAGIKVGRVYFRYFSFQDDMRQSARFAQQLTDSAITSRLAMAADSLGLPPAAKSIRVTRQAQTITLSSSYAELVDLHVWSHVIRLNPRVVEHY
jgi:hypothetical protein